LTVLFHDTILLQANDFADFRIEYIFAVK